MNLRIRKGAARNLQALLVLVLVICAIPSLSRKVRKVDTDGYPLTMEARDPAKVGWFAPDGVHPNATGYEARARGIAAKIRDCLNV